LDQGNWLAVGPGQLAGCWSRAFGWLLDRAIGWLLDRAIGWLLDRAIGWLLDRAIGWLLDQGNWLAVGPGNWLAVGPDNLLAVGPGNWLAVIRLWEPRLVLYVLLPLLNHFKAYTPPFCDSVPEISRLTVAT